MSAQQSIPYQRMYPDGVCRVTDNYYTKTILFQDINYQLAQNEDKQTIFEGWCEFLNYFDASIHFQFTFFNTSAGADGYERSIRIAKTEGVSRMAVSASIERGLRQMEKWLKTTNPAFTNGKKLPI